MVISNNWAIWLEKMITISFRLRPLRRTHDSPKPLLRPHRPQSPRRPDHARARDLRAACVQRAHRSGELGAGGDDFRDGLAVDYCGDSELREALGGAGHVARFAFRLADPHVLVRAVVAGRGRDGVRHVHRLPGRGGDLGSDGPVGAVPHRARLVDAFGGEADAAGGRRLEARRVRAARGYLRPVLEAAANAAFARRTRLGCRTPSLGVWPCGAPGGTRNHCSLYGNSFTLRRSNLVGTLSPESVYASPSAGRIRNSPGYSLSMFCEVPYATATCGLPSISPTVSTSAGRGLGAGPGSPFSGKRQ